ncbi:MAG: restriction endonuclease subunit S, partial [Lachnospiraceae bacterium]
VCIADEVPFDIPESWEWVRLGEIFQHNTGKALNSSNKSGVLLEYITTSNLYWDRFELENLRSMYFTENEIEKCQVSKGDLLVCEGGDIGRAAIWLKDYKICIQNHIHRLRSYVPLCTRFYYYVFFLYKYAGWIGGKGIGIQGLSSNALHSLLVPVPPIAEQERIVKRLEIIKPLSDKYSEASEQIQELNNLFPEHLKKSILQYAVQGKLVPQDPADEPASVLLERIRTEKEKLIKAGKIKRDKHESVIFRRDNSYYEKVDGIERCIDDELPFEIPDSWEWTTIGTTCINIQYGSSRKSESTGTMAVLRMGNIQNGRIDTQKLVYTSDKEEIAHYPLEYNDLLFNRTNSKELVGKTAIYKSEVSAIYAGYLIRITPLIDSDYLNYVMQTQFYWVYCQNVRSDAIGQSNINAEKLKKFIYPLPPLHEQKRIAKKLNSIFTKIK